MDSHHQYSQHELLNDCQIFEYEEDNIINKDHSDNCQELYPPPPSSASNGVTNNALLPGTSFVPEILSQYPDSETVENQNQENVMEESEEEEEESNLVTQPVEQPHQPSSQPGPSTPSADNQLGAESEEEKPPRKRRRLSSDEWNTSEEEGYDPADFVTTDEDPENPSIGILQTQLQYEQDHQQNLTYVRQQLLILRNNIEANRPSRILASRAIANSLAVPQIVVRVSPTRNVTIGSNISESGRTSTFYQENPPEIIDEDDDDDQFYENELEVANHSDVNENPNPIENENSSSDPGPEPEILECPTECIVPTGPNPDFELEQNFGDEDEGKRDEIEILSEQKESSEITKSKRILTCIQCHARHQRFRFCLRCFQARKDWLPDRPKSRRLKKRKRQINQERIRSSQRMVQASVRVRVLNELDQKESEDENMVVDSFSFNNTLANQSSTTPISQATIISLQNKNENQLNLMLTPPPSLANSQNNSQNISNSQENSQNLRTPELTQSQGISSEYPESQLTTQPDSQSIFSSNPNSQNLSQNADLLPQLPTVPVPLTSPNSNIQSGEVNSQNDSAYSSQLCDTPTPTLISDKLCEICLSRDKNAAFVHNKIAHSGYCCYTCGDILLKKGGRCPICREKVWRVVKIIDA